jgi:hypothetical protein
MIPNASSAAEAVANGAALLDERMPGWYDSIDLDVLSVRSPEFCICGQLKHKEEDVWTVLGKNIDEAAARGVYCLSSCDWTYADLDREWAKLIQARREARVPSALLQEVHA